MLQGFQGRFVAFAEASGDADIDGLQRQLHDGDLMYCRQSRETGASHHPTLRSEAPHYGHFNLVN